MDNQSLSDKLAAIVVALLLIFVAWGNAVVMLIASALGLAVSVILFRKQITRGGVLSATSGLVLGIAIALIMLLR